MQNLSLTKKVLLGAGAVFVAYYAWKMWQSHEIKEKNKKLVSSTLAPTTDSSIAPPMAFTEA